MSLAMAAVLLAAAVPQGPVCAAYRGTKVSPVPISEVFGAIAKIPPKDEFETTADYERRTQAARAGLPSGPILIDRPWARQRPIYDADKSLLTFYAWTLGQSELDFGSLLGIGTQPLARGVAIDIAERTESQSSYEGTNGFGAKVQVSRTVKSVDTIWERWLKWFGNSFANSKSSAIVAQLPMPAAQARDVVENGGSAVVAVLRPPYLMTGLTVSGPTFQVPLETQRNVRALTADIQCVLVYNGAKQVVMTFEVK
jgi:hypothetical protein